MIAVPTRIFVGFREPDPRRRRDHVGAVSFRGPARVEAEPFRLGDRRPRRRAAARRSSSRCSGRASGHAPCGAHTTEARATASGAPCISWSCELPALSVTTSVSLAFSFFLRFERLLDGLLGLARQLQAELRLAGAERLVDRREPEDLRRRPARSPSPTSFTLTASPGLSVMLSLSTSCEDDAVTAPSASTLSGARRRRRRRRRRRMARGGAGRRWGLESSPLTMVRPVSVLHERAVRPGRSTTCT